MSSTPTQEELGIEQAEGPLNINRERLRVMEYIETRRARRNPAGRDVLAPANGGDGYGSMLGRKVQELWRAGLAVLGPDGYYVLTAAGVRRRDESRAEYAAAHVTAGK